MTQAFWRTIERIPGHATDTRDWQLGISEEWEKAKHYLKKSSVYAKKIDCPFPGGEHCPRHIIRHSDESVRGVCGDPERICETLELTDDQIRIRELDYGRLYADIATALNLVPPREGPRRQGLVHLGDYAIAAGSSFPIYAALVCPRDRLGLTDVLDLDRSRLPFVLLVTSVGMVEPDVAKFLTLRRARVLTFDDLLVFAENPRRGFVASVPPAKLFAPEIAALDESDDQTPRPVMSLPAGTRWGDLRFTFREEAVLNVSYRGGTPTRLEPDQLGMHDRRKSKPNRQWRLLIACAVLHGALPRSFPVSTIKGKRPTADILRILRQFERGYDRQRQFLAAALKMHFGIGEDPFIAGDDCYEARFLLDASALRQGRAGQSSRNFVEDD